MMVLAIGVLCWLAFDAGFVIGAAWAARRPAQSYPVPEFRRVAHPCLVARVQGQETDYIAIAADYIAPRQDFAAADRRVLDELLERHTW